MLSFNEQIDRDTGQDQCDANRSLPGPGDDRVEAQVQAKKDVNDRYDGISPDFIRTVRVGHSTAQNDHAQRYRTVKDENSKY